MELQLLRTWRVRHRIIPGRHAGQRKRCILGRRKVESRASHLEPKTQDNIMRQKRGIHDLGVNPAKGVADRLVFIPQPDHARGSLRHRAARKDKAAISIFGCEGEARVVDEFDLSARQTRLARSATSGLAAVRVVDALGQRCLKDFLSVRHLYSPTDDEKSNVRHFGALRCSKVCSLRRK